MMRIESSVKSQIPENYCIEDLLHYQNLENSYFSRLKNCYFPDIHLILKNFFPSSDEKAFFGFSYCINFNKIYVLHFESVQNRLCGN